MNRERGFPAWDRELERELFTEEEIAENDARVAVISDMVEARNEKVMSRRELEELTSIRQPQLARPEAGKGSPTLTTPMKVLVPLGKKLAVVPIREDRMLYEYRAISASLSL